MDRRVRTVLTILDQEYHRNLRCADLAAAVGVGQSRLEHLFKDHIRTSIRDYVRRRRLAEGARLLATTTARVSEVARAVGFGDAANFSHAFTAEYGMSPRAYRVENLQLPPPFDNSHQD
jgi:transcriptional regulator GlxA family with amidase domain